MAEFGEATQAVTGQALRVILSSTKGGDVSIGISTDSVQVAKHICEIAGKFALPLGVLYVSYRLLGKLIDSSAKRGLGGERDDQEVRNIQPGSLHVLLHCFTDERFMEVFEDYESGRMKDRLQKEFLQAGIEVEGLKVEILNMDAVKETIAAIDIRKSFAKATTKGEASKAKISNQEVSPFGQKEPPLTDHIVNILGRYSDGGQILKELIQNADDAGAREVKFLYDGRSFGTKFLVSEPLQKFQGPALWAFNDAIFQPEDWEGIQNLMRSNKKTDILKVGRFGIGFNSVYYITDLPTIVSGEHIGFLDPHKCYFEKGESGQKYKINPNLLKGDIRDQFKPFQGVFGLDFNTFYNSTLFRFPLRVHPSELSKTEYTREKVNKLFESLLEEAPIILLFMKSVQHISVYERVGNDDDVKCVFKVEIAPKMCDVVKKSREMMLKKAVEQSVTKSSYVVDICLSSESDGERVYKWLVLNQIGAEGEEKISELSKKLSLSPWVGCAVPLNKDAERENTGRIFCFLPLPRDVDCQTGLPVLLHGPFGVTDNRRGLMWPGSECQNNDTAEWNVLLVQKILCTVMYNALKSIILDNPVSGLEEIQRRELVYSTVPKISDVVGHWECLLVPLFQGLKQLNLFYAKSSSGTSWITLQEGILDQLETVGVAKETRRVVLATLLKNSQIIITDLPEHMSEVIGKYFGERREITSKFFRAFLKHNSIHQESYDDKLKLLEFVLHDDPHPDELNGVPLLPLASRKFATFKQHCHNSDPSSSIFVSSGNCTEDLLPNMENRFLDKNIPTGIHEKLVAMATGLVDDVNPTQLITLTPDLLFALQSSG